MHLWILVPSIFDMNDLIFSSADERLPVLHVQPRFFQPKKYWITLIILVWNLEKNQLDRNLIVVEINAPILYEFNLPPLFQP